MYPSTLIPEIKQFTDIWSLKSDKSPSLGAGMKKMDGKAKVFSLITFIFFLPVVNSSTGCNNRIVVDLQDFLNSASRKRNLCRKYSYISKDIFPQVRWKFSPGSFSLHINWKIKINYTILCINSKLYHWKSYNSLIQQFKLFNCQIEKKSWNLKKIPGFVNFSPGTNRTLRTHFWNVSLSWKFSYH